MQQERKLSQQLYLLLDWIELNRNLLNLLQDINPSNQSDFATNPSRDQRTFRFDATQKHLGRKGSGGSWLDRSFPGGSAAQFSGNKRQLISFDSCFALFRHSGLSVDFLSSHCAILQHSSDPDNTQKPTPTYRSCRQPAD